jgi:hypothetical protein
MKFLGIVAGCRRRHHVRNQAKRYLRSQIKYFNIKRNFPSHGKMDVRIFTEYFTSTYKEREK